MSLFLFILFHNYFMALKFRITPLPTSPQCSKTWCLATKKTLTKNSYQLKGHKAMKWTNKYSNKCWTKGNIDRLLKSSQTSAQSTDSHSGEPRSIRTKEYVDAVNDLVLSQENTQTHRTICENLIIRRVVMKSPPWIC